MKIYKINAFTLVELIVVITILAILGTISFISLQGYSAQSRDSTRISDLSTMRTSLELFQLDAGKYPLPTDGVDITYSGGTVWNQGIFGESIFKNVEKLDKIPTDPLTNSKYTYSITANKNEYEIAGITETVFALNILENTYAGDTEATAIVTGTYNGQMTKTLSGETCDVLSIPSIIANDIEISTDIVEITNNERFVYDGYNNLPSSYKSSKFKIDAGFKFKVNKLVAYTDTGSCTALTSKSSYEARIELIKGLQSAYTGTLLKGEGKIKRILALDIDVNSPSIEVQNFAGSFVNNNLSGNVVILNSSSSAGGSVNIGFMGSGGRTHSCAVSNLGGLKCWGNNNHGQLGDGTTTNSNIPVDVVGLSSGVSSVSMGYYHTCATLINGGLKCWGYNGFGQLGNGTLIESHLPVDVSGLTNGVSSSSLGQYFTCAILDTGGLKCWGTNGAGQLGIGNTFPSYIPIGVTGLSSGVTDISLGYDHTCAIVNGGAKCWGVNTDGEVGDGSGINRYIPTTPSGLSTGVTDISAGWHTSCAVKDGGAKCWGDSRWGQVGDNGTTYRAIPVNVNGLTSGVLNINSGYHHTCALLDTGGVKCWGAGGKTGDGTGSQRNAPVDVVGLSSGIISISLGNNHSCAITTSLGLKCWGDGSYGEFGNGTNTSSASPIDIPEIF